MRWKCVGSSDTDTPLTNAVLRWHRRKHYPQVIAQFAQKPTDTHVRSLLTHIHESISGRFSATNLSSNSFELNLDFKFILHSYSKTPTTRRGVAMSQLEESEWVLFVWPTLSLSSSDISRGLIDQSCSISQETNRKEKNNQLIYPFVTLPQAFYSFSSVDIGLLLWICKNHVSLLSGRHDYFNYPFIVWKAVHSVKKSSLRDL